MPVYVDDMTFVSKDKAAIARAIAELSTHFALRDLFLHSQFFFSGLSSIFL